MSRPISITEAAIVERALQVAPSKEISPEIFASIQGLMVTATCDCGCATVWFGPDGDASIGRIWADARATAAGEGIDLIIWGSDEAIVGLELVGVGKTPLPKVESVRGHDVA
jgi:hypothetical protein